MIATYQNSNRLPQHLVMPELQLPMQYGVGFEWGSLHVTEQAHEAYGFVPLAPTTSDPAELSAGYDDTFPKLEVVLVAPDELPVPPVRDAAWASNVRSARSIGIVAGLGANRQQFAADFGQQLADDFRRQTGDTELSKEEILQRLVTSEGISVAEGMEGHASQIMIHMVNEAIYDEAKIATTEWIRMQDQQLLRRKVGGIGTVGIAGAFSPLIALTAAGIPLQPGSLVMPLATVVAAKVATNLSLRRWFGSYPNRAQEYERIGDERATTAGDDIHALYCTDHFDKNFSEEPKDE